MSAFDARSATEVNIPQWSPVWVSEDFSKSMIVRLNALYSPTRQNETLEGRSKDRRARQIEMSSGSRCEIPNVVVETSWKVSKDGRARQIEMLGQK